MLPEQQSCGLMGYVRLTVFNPAEKNTSFKPLIISYLENGSCDRNYQISGRKSMSSEGAYLTSLSKWHLFKLLVAGQ